MTLAGRQAMPHVCIATAHTFQPVCFCKTGACGFYNQALMTSEWWLSRVVHELGHGFWHTKKIALKVNVGVVVG